jgi:hypothetical protein
MKRAIRRAVKRAIKNSTLYKTYRASRLFDEVTHVRRSALDAEYRKRDRDALADFRRFCNECGGRALGADVSPSGGRRKTALILSQAYLPFAKIEAFVTKAVQMAGYEPVFLCNRQYSFLRYGWLAGNTRFIERSDFPCADESAWVDEQVQRLTSLEAWLALEYRGVRVGRFVIASTLRRRMVGTLDFTDPSDREILRYYLGFSVQNVLISGEVLDRIKPDVVLMMDRGYAGFGEMFDAAVARGIDTVNWIMGYKSDRLAFKRYNAKNSREHPLSMSDDTWQRLGSIPWTPAHSREIRQELFRSYESQDWFSVVGTQVDKKLLSQDATRAHLGLRADKKVAVVFVHILWDGSFFYGEDLFKDYTEWFVETIRAAIGNDRLQWVVKLHPAHLVKAKQKNTERRPAELDVIEKEFGSLPPHITLVHPDTEVSTYSLFEIADYTVTVRGTVGIESSLFGVPAITAGTGRYDRRGFTVDSSSREEYLRKLATLESIPRLTPEQVTCAERYAYGLLFWRPLALSSASLEFERGEKALPKFVIQCRTRSQWLASPDMNRLSRWIAEGVFEDMPVVVAAPDTAPAVETSAAYGE